MIIVTASIITMIIILSLAAVGGSLSERSGIINLSIEGFMTIGAIVYALIVANGGFESMANQFWIMPMAGLCTGAFATIYAFVTVKLKANQTIAGIALNAFALAISLFLIHSNANPSHSDKMSLQGHLWAAADSNTSAGWIFNIAIVLGLPIISLTIVFLNMTKFGKKIKAVGENPHAAASLGIKVENVQFISVMLAGTICGIAGALFAQKSSLFYGSTQGVGFLAVALVVFGQWRPTIIIAGAILFGVTTGLVEQYQLVPFLAGFESQSLLQLIPYALSLLVLVFTSKNAKAPKALGIPYVNAGR